MKMKKVRIYSLKKELGLDNCTPILNTCQQMGIKAKSASSTITKSQARQVTQLLTDAAPTVLRTPSKSTRSPKSETAGLTATPSKQRSTNSSAVKRAIPSKLEAKPPKSAKPFQPASPQPLTGAASKPRSSKSPAKSTRPKQLSDLPAIGTAMKAVETECGERASRAVMPKPATNRYLNGNRVFTLQIAGLRGARTRQAITTYSVPYNRLGREIQRINRSEAKIVDISLNL